MNQVVLIVQIIISLLLIGAIVIQVKGGGLSRGIMSGNSFSRRGFERLVFRATFVLCAVFLVISTATLVF